MALCDNQDLGDSVYPKLDSARRSMTSDALLRVESLNFLLKLEFLKRSDLETWVALLIAVIPQLESRAGQAPIGFNEAALQRTDTRIGRSTFCSMVVVDGDEFSSSLELEKLLQVCSEKYPSLSLGFFFFKRVSGAKIGGVIVQSSEGEARLITPDLWSKKCRLEKSFQGLDRSFLTIGRLDLGLQAELRHGSGNKSIVAAPSSTTDGSLKVRYIQSSVKVLHSSDTDLARIELPQIARFGFDGTIPKRFQIFVKMPKGNTIVIWTYGNDSVTDFKNNIVVQTGYPAAKQHLLNEGRSMQDCKTMQDYNIKSGSTIILNMRLRGGAEISGTSLQNKGSFKESVKGKGKTNPTATTKPLGPYIVDQIPESPSISIDIPKVERRLLEDPYVAL